MSVKEIIEESKNKYPLSVQGRFRFTESEAEELENHCCVRCSSVYMDGSGYYSIRWKKPNAPTVYMV